MKRTFIINVSGNHKTWGFPFKADEAHLQEWLADGLHVDEVVNTVPGWVVRAGLTRIWCRAQDVWQWLRIW